MKIFDAEEIIVDGIAYKAIAYRNPVHGETYLAPYGGGSSGVFMCDVQEFWAQRLVVERVEPEYITPTQEDVIKYNFPVVEVDAGDGWCTRILLAVYENAFYTKMPDSSVAEFGFYLRNSRCRMVNQNLKKA